ncbi:MAG TPA: magnesium/cobalt transporter CorA [Dictyobacter sp.]|jgi:magnesium transporter|nr:magnesium/cobalt transporter CorA [Dictyobacter sp.]
MQQLFIWQQGKLQTDCSLEHLHEVLQDPEALIWLDLQIEHTLDKYKDLLLSVFQLSHLTIETIKEQRERARLVHQHDYFYLVTHSLIFDQELQDARTPKLDVVFKQNFLITIHQEPMQWLTELLEATRNDETEEQLLSQGMPILLHAILDAQVDSYFPVLDGLDTIMDDLEESTVTQATNEVQARIFRMKRVVATMRRVISPQVEVANSLITRTGDLIPAEREPYFADIHDHLVRTFEVLDSYRDLMSSLLDVYLTTVSNRLNQIMKQLAIISTIFLPITFITGVFGQNFGTSPQVKYDAGYNFWIVLAFMLIITIGQIMYFRHRKWI